MSNLLLKDLIAFGLSEKEAQIYLALLELGNASANQIAEKSGVNRSSTYVVINSLKSKGMVGSIEKATVQEFFAISPEILTRTAESSLHTAQEKLERIQNILPELKGMYKDFTHHPSVRVFEGIAGLGNTLIETVINNEEKQLRSFTSGEMILSLIPEYLLKWNTERLKNKICIKTIFVDNAASHIILAMTAGRGKNVFVPKENYPFPVDAIIWDNAVCSGPRSLNTNLV